MTSHQLLKMMVRNLLESKRAGWSRQGLGMLRCYLDDKHMYRLHVWDSSLRVPGVSPLHTHPWDMESTVIAGVYQQRRYTPATLLDFSRNKERMQEFNKVRIKCGENACVKEEPTKESLVMEQVETILEGFSYAQKADEIHESFPLDGTVTLVKRTFKPDTEHADVFWRGTGGWVDAKPESVLSDSAILTDVLDRTLEAWF